MASTYGNIANNAMSPIAQLLQLLQGGGSSSPGFSLGQPTDPSNPYGITDHAPVYSPYDYAKSQPYTIGPVDPARWAAYLDHEVQGKIGPINIGQSPAGDSLGVSSDPNASLQNAAATGRAGPAGPTDPESSLLAALARLYNQGSGFDYQSALDSMKAQIAAAYAPQISAVRNQSKVARKQEGQNADEVQKMYGALARFDERAGNRVDARTKGEVGALRNIGNRSQAAIEKATNASLNGQGQLLSSLGLEAAAPALAKLSRTGGREATQAARSNQSSQELAKQLGINSANYETRAGSGAKLEGTNAQVDLMKQLQDTLATNRSSVAQLLGAKGTSIANAISQLQGIQASHTNDAFGQLQTLYSDYASQKAAQQAQALALAKLQLAAGGTSAGASQYLPKNVQNTYKYLLTALPQKEQIPAADILKSFLALATVQSGSHSNQDTGNKAVPNNAEWAMQRISELAAQSGHPELAQALAQAIQAYYG